MLANIALYSFAILSDKEKETINQLYCVHEGIKNKTAIGLNMIIMKLYSQT